MVSDFLGRERSDKNESFCVVVLRVIRRGCSFLSERAVSFCVKNHVGSRRKRFGRAVIRCAAEIFPNLEDDQIFEAIKFKAFRVLKLRLEKNFNPTIKFQQHPTRHSN